MRNPRAYLKELLREALPIYCSGSVVDVGSGHAKYGNMIRQYSTSYVTVDNLSSEDQFGTTTFVPDVIASVDNIPLPDNSFDTAVCTEVLEHVPDPFVVVGEIARLLKPGGFAFISSGWIAAHHKEPDDYWRFSLSAYKLLADRAGMDFVTSYRKGGLWTVLLYIMSRNIVLNSKRAWLRALWRKVHKPLELIAETMDSWVVTEDTIGHLVVVRKRI